MGTFILFVVGAVVLWAIWIELDDRFGWKPAPCSNCDPGAGGTSECQACYESSRR